jgi:precorrin-3B synthase
VSVSTCAPRTGRDRCPGALALHAAEDGALARVRLPGGRIDARGRAAVAEAAALGNGIVEITSRANLQIRGLPRDAGEAVATLLAAGGLLPSLEHDRVRNVLASALGGRDDVVDAIDRGLCADPAFTELPGRFLFAVDEPGHGADVLLLGDALWLGGAATTLRGGAELALAAARAFLAERTTEWRLREVPDGPARVVARLGGELVEGDEPAAAVLTPGVRGDAIVALAPLGRLDADVLRALPGVVRLSPWRTMTVTGAPAAELEALGLVVRPGSGWAGLSACAGLGACAKARLDVRAAAARRAAVRDDGAPSEHWSACERRCGERPGVEVAVHAAGDGIAVRVGDRETQAAGVDEAVALL